MPDCKVFLWAGNEFLFHCACAGTLQNNILVRPPSLCADSTDSSVRNCCRFLVCDFVDNCGSICWIQKEYLCIKCANYSQIQKKMHGRFPRAYPNFVVWDRCSPTVHPAVNWCLVEALGGKT